MESANPYGAPRSDINADLQAGAQLPLAGRGSRLGARLLDGVIEVLPIMVGVGLTAALSSPEQPVFWPAALGYVVFFAVWIYQIVRLVQTGQTLGKKWLGIKVVRNDGGKVSFGAHFLRGLVLGLLGLISALFIFRQDQRCLHDMAGETKVVQA
jgi:uncharacterized RDD family membrane protein YckC